MLGFSIWLALYFVLCIATDMITLESHKNHEHLGQCFDPQYRAQRQSRTCMNKTFSLTAPDCWRLKRGEDLCRAEGAGGARVSGWGRSVCLHHLSSDRGCRNTSYKQSQSLSCLRILLLNYAVQPHIGGAEKGREKKSRSNMCTVLKAWFQVFCNSFPLVS